MRWCVSIGALLLAAILTILVAAPLGSILLRAVVTPDRFALTVDHLLAEGWRDLTVLDLSSAALATARDFDGS